MLKTCFTTEAPKEHLSPLSVLRQSRTTFNFKTYTKTCANVFSTTFKNQYMPARITL